MVSAKTDLPTALSARHEGTVKVATFAPPLDTSGLRYDYEQIAPEHRQQVMEVAADIRQRERRAADDLIAIGHHLIATKEMIPHGKFLDWLETEFAYGERMARELMNVARRFGQNGAIRADLNPTIMRMLAAPSVPDDAIEEVLDFVEREGRPPKVAETEQIIKLHKAPPKMITVNATVTTPEPMRESAASDMLRFSAELEEAGYRLLGGEGEWTWEWRFGSPEFWKRGNVFRDKIACFAEALTDFEKRFPPKPAPKPEPTPEPAPVALDTPADLRARGLVIEEYYPDGQTCYRWRGIAEPNQGQVGAGQSSIEDAIRHARRCFEIFESYPADLVRKAIEEIAPEPDPDEAAAVAAIEAEAAEEEATRVAIDGAPVDSPYGMVSRAWVLHTLTKVNPAHADFASALKMAVAEDLREALANLSNADPTAPERSAHIRARLKALILEQAQAATTEAVAARAAAPIHRVDAWLALMPTGLDADECLRVCEGIKPVVQRLREIEERARIFAPDALRSLSLLINETRKVRRG